MNSPRQIWSTPSKQGIQPLYCGVTPNNQTAVDIFKGLWKSSFPDESDVQAGSVPNFRDARVTWVNDKLGGLEHKCVLELGPFEAYNTWQFSRLGAFPITAVEGNNINYLKCLVVKEILDINARFLHGDIGSFLSVTEDRYDLCWACGVLYHQVNPLALLKLISTVCRSVFVWTHFYNDKIASNPRRYPHFDASRDVEKNLDGYSCKHYYRSYMHKKGIPACFSGGSEAFSYWLSKDDILAYLAMVGFTDILIRGSNLEHKAGPTLSFLASRPKKDATSVDMERHESSGVSP